MTINQLTAVNSASYIKSVSKANASSGASVSIYADKTKNLNSGLLFEKTPEEDMHIIAHRGYSAVAPENTIPAFVAAAKNGFEAVECDVSWTKDGVPVILHDSTINRTARHKNGWGLIFTRKCSDMNYKDLLKLDFGVWKGDQYKGTKIPTFSEFADCCSEYDLKPYVEIKQTEDFSPEKAKKLVDAIKQAGLEDKVTWISFNPEYLKMINQVMPDSRLGLLSSETPSDTTIATLNSLKNDKNEVFLDVKSDAMNADSNKLLEDAGYDFEAWTVDDGKELDRLEDFDCKGITTNILTESEAAKFLDD